MEASRRFFAAHPRLRTAVAVTVSLLAGLLSLWHLRRVMDEDPPDRRGGSTGGPGAPRAGGCRIGPRSAADRGEGTGDGVGPTRRGRPAGGAR